MTSEKKAFDKCEKSCRWVCPARVATSQNLHFCLFFCSSVSGIQIEGRLFPPVGCLCIKSPPKFSKLWAHTTKSLRSVLPVFFVVLCQRPDVPSIRVSSAGLLSWQGLCLVSPSWRDNALICSIDATGKSQVHHLPSIQDCHADFRTCLSFTYMQQRLKGWWWWGFNPMITPNWIDYKRGNFLISHKIQFSQNGNKEFPPFPVFFPNQPRATKKCPSIPTNFNGSIWNFFFFWLHKFLPHLPFSCWTETLPTESERKKWPKV